MADDATRLGQARELHEQSRWAEACEHFQSERTVHRHINNIFDKLGVHSRTAAASYAAQHHIVDAGVL